MVAIAWVLRDDIFLAYFLVGQGFPKLPASKVRTTTPRSNLRKTRDRIPYKPVTFGPIKLCSHLLTFIILCLPSLVSVIPCSFYSYWITFKETGTKDLVVGASKRRICALSARHDINKWPQDIWKHIISGAETLGRILSSNWGYVNRISGIRGQN